MPATSLPSYMTHYVYAMMCRDGSGQGYIKLGITRDIGKRLTAIKIGCPLEIFELAVIDVAGAAIARKIEKALHREFSDRNERGEWFRFTFSDAADKRVFNDGCRKVFASASKGGFALWWSKMSIAAIEEADRQRKRELLKCGLLNKLQRRKLADKELRH